MIFALVALGYTLVYGIIELINFAHGDVFMIGTMLSLRLTGLVERRLGAPDHAETPLSPSSWLLATLLISMVAAPCSTSPSSGSPTDRCGMRPRWRR